jgi:hypothetical protein
MFQVGDLVKYKDDYLKTISLNTYKYFEGITYIINSLKIEGWEVKVYGYDTQRENPHITFLGYTNILELVDAPCEITDFL